ncbi:MAG: riboflavin synthase [Polyangiaceae bacterium]
MFTGLVETTGVIRRRSGGPVARVWIEGRFDSGLVLGESISVNGACLTVDRILDGGFEVDVSAETLARTTLGEMAVGARVHLERATKAGGRLGGHIVAGHVDGVGRVASRQKSGDAVALGVRVPGELGGFLAAKGSVTLDGVSLTINAVSGGAGDAEAGIEVMLVPHTLGATMLGELRAGDRVNVEVDVLARYVARWLEFRGALGAPAAAAPTHHDDERLLEKLRTGGFF